MSLRFIVALLWLAVGLPAGAAWAQLVAPSNGGEVSLIRVTATSIELSFGLTGTGQGRVVTMAAIPLNPDGTAGSPGSLAAVNGTLYQGDATYAKGTPLGTGYVVYSGAGHSITVTGLQPSTRYYITNAEYNSDNSTVLYNTRSSSVTTTTRQATTSIASPTPLPVELTSFVGATDSHDMATLHWTTATEYNSDYFVVERSPDGTTFAQVGQVLAVGTSSQATTYKWPDPRQLTASTYYRLRQVDRDGVARYSNVIVVAPTPPKARLLEVYPNPSVDGTLQLLLQGYNGETLTLHLADALGRQVLTQIIVPADASYTALLQLPSSVIPGTYTLIIKGSGIPVQKHIAVSN